MCIRDRFCALSCLDILYLLRDNDLLAGLILFLKIFEMCIRDRAYHALHEVSHPFGFQQCVERMRSAERIPQVECGVIDVYKRQGYNAYGLPAEQYAIQTGQHPAITTKANIDRYREQLDKIGFSLSLIHIYYSEYPQPHSFPP